MLYFNSDGTPLNFGTIANIGRVETGGDTGGPQPIHGAGTQITPKSLQMQPYAPTTPQPTPLAAPQGGSSPISPQTVLSLKNIIQQRQFASPAQQASSAVYQDPNLQVGPQTPSTPQAGDQYGPATPAAGDIPASGDSSGMGPSSDQLLQSQGLSSSGTGDMLGGGDSGGGMMGGGGGGGMGMGMAAAQILESAAKADQANAAKEIQITSQGAQTGTAQYKPAQFQTVDLSQSNMPL